MKLLKKFVLVLLTIIIISFGSFYIYSLNYYKAFDSVDPIIKETTIKDDNIYFDGTNKDIGIIIYPGAKVEASAYAFLAKELNDYGYTVVIADFPLRFAFLDINVCDDIIKARKDISSWVIVGHSLGGTMAGYSARDNTSISALVFLASYTTANVNVDSLYIYGSNDNVLSKDKVPTDNLYIIEGGNHAGFASYGPQKNDGKLEITREIQIEVTVNKIIEFIES